MMSTHKEQMKRARRIPERAAAALFFHEKSLNTLMVMKGPSMGPGPAPFPASPQSLQELWALTGAAELHQG